MAAHRAPCWWKELGNWATGPHGSLTRACRSSRQLRPRDVKDASALALMPALQSPPRLNNTRTWRSITPLSIGRSPPQRPDWAGFCFRPRPGSLGPTCLLQHLAHTLHWPRRTPSQQHQPGWLKLPWLLPVPSTVSLPALAATGDEYEPEPEHDLLDTTHCTCTCTGSRATPGQGRGEYMCACAGSKPRCQNMTGTHEVRDFSGSCRRRHGMRTMPWWPINKL